jgi:hypothetical protein
VVYEGTLTARIGRVKRCRLFLFGLFAIAMVHSAAAGNLQRVDHATFLPRHSSPDDKGMYAAAIDPTNGYAYFVGTYLTKVDIAVDPPQPIGTALNTGQFPSSAIDLGAGYYYLAQSSVGIARYALGVGTNPVAAAGTLLPTAGSAREVVVDDSDPNPANHYAYVVCAVSGAPAKVSKIALSTFTELNSISLNAGETNFTLAALADPKNGYAYFVNMPDPNSAPVVVKIKMTPGLSPPVRIGAASLNTVGEFIDGGCIDTVHGYAYYGSYNSDTNIVGKVYKVRLESGDVPPTFVGFTGLHAGEGRLAAAVADPQNGFVYFANDNTYPGDICQLGMNGTNLPVEVTYYPLPGGPETPPPSGITTNNTTTNVDGILPFGEVFFRSAVIDPLRGYAYFGQDSRPNQIVKMKLAQIDPFAVTGAQTNGSLQVTFTNIFGAAFRVFTATNLALPYSNWILSTNPVTEISPGQYQFTDSANVPCQFYRVQSP